MTRDKQVGESVDIQPVKELADVPTFWAGMAKDQPTAEETAYKTIKRKDEEPISIELGRNETAAAKAAMG